MDGKEYDRRITTAMRHADGTLKILLNTLPTTIFGLASVLQHLATPENNDPGQLNILIGACEAGDPELRSAAESYLTRLGAAVQAMNMTVHSAA
jgi:hypothetical protein